MRILLIYPDFPEWDSGGAYYTGIASIYSSIKATGRHEPEFWHITRTVSEEEFTRTVREKNVDIVAFSCTTPMFRYVREWAVWVQRHLKKFMVCGGTHGRMDPMEILENTPITAVCTGEGERAIVELLDHLENKKDFSRIKNFAFRIDGKITQTPLELIYDLESLPDPDRDIFSHLSLYDYTKKGFASTAAFIFSRGCPFSCTFCSNKRLRQSYSDKSNYVRRISPRKAVNQIVDHMEKYPITEYIRIHDSIINLDKEWFRSFAKLYRENVNVPYICMTVAPLCNEEFVDILEESNCLMVMMGIEHAGAQYRKNILGRPMSEGEILKAFKLCRERKIATRAYNMFGLLFDSIDMMLETIKLNAMAFVYDMNVTIFYPFPGTELFDLCKKKGFTLSRVESVSWPNEVLQQPSVTVNEVYLTYTIAHILLYHYGLIFRFVPEEYLEKSIRFIDEEARFYIQSNSERLTRKDFDRLKTMDLQAHRQYKKINSSENGRYKDLLLRV